MGGDERQRQLIALRHHLRAALSTLETYMQGAGADAGLDDRDDDLDVVDDAGAELTEAGALAAGLSVAVATLRALEPPPPPPAPPQAFPFSMSEVRKLLVQYGDEDDRARYGA